MNELSTVFIMICPLLGSQLAILVQVRLHRSLYPYTGSLRYQTGLVRSTESLSVLSFILARDTIFVLYIFGKQFSTL